MEAKKNLKKNTNNAGKNKEEELNYGFVVLSNDVMQDDKDEEYAYGEWFGCNKNGYLEVMDDTTNDIPIGSIICSVTVDLVEISDGVYQVPETLNTMVKFKLEKQLMKDNDNAHCYYDDVNYEKRMEMMWRKKKSKSVDESGKNKKREQANNVCDEPVSDHIGSGFTLPPNVDHRKLFPRIPSLVNNIEHKDLLKDLLHALDNYHCLDSPIWRGRRSPWVRAFCHLHHPSGPWGDRKFKNTPSITSTKRHNFKSYFVQKVYDNLKKCNDSSCGVHSRSKERMDKFMEMKEYYDECMKAIVVFVEKEALKPQKDRLTVLTLNLAGNPKAGTEGNRECAFAENTIFPEDNGVEVNSAPVNIAESNDKHSKRNSINLASEAASVAKLQKQKVYHDDDGRNNSESGKLEYEVSASNIQKQKIFHDGDNSDYGKSGKLESDFASTSKIQKQEALPDDNNSYVTYPTPAYQQFADNTFDDKRSGSGAKSKPHKQKSFHDDNDYDDNDRFHDEQSLSASNIKFKSTLVSTIRKSRHDIDDYNTKIEDNCGPLQKRQKFADSTSERKTNTDPFLLQANVTRHPSEVANEEPVVVSPELMRKKPTQESCLGSKAVYHDREQVIHNKRNKLADLLKKRQNENSFGQDAVSERLKANIDKLDSELMDLILEGEG